MRPRDLISNKFEARARGSKKSLDKILQAGGGDAFLNYQKDSKHCKINIYCKNHRGFKRDLKPDFGAFTLGNHVNIEGFELSSA